MTTMTAPRRATHVDSPHRLTFPRLLRGEWVKLATLRSTWWSIGIAAALTVGIALLVAGAIGAEPGFEPIRAVTSPFQFTMLVAGILGAIAVTGEYSTGMIRSTFAAQPVRGAVLAAKAIVVALLMAVSSLVIFFGAALTVTPVFAGRDIAFGWDDPAASVLPILIASASMAAFALIGLIFGFLLRSGAGAIAATVGLLFVLPLILNLFAVVGAGWEWIATIAAHLPVMAAQSAILPQDGMGVSQGEGALTLMAWIVAGLLGAWAVLRSRDA